MGKACNAKGQSKVDTTFARAAATAAALDTKGKGGKFGKGKDDRAADSFGNYGDGYDFYFSGSGKGDVKGKGSKGKGYYGHKGKGKYGDYEDDESSDDGNHWESNDNQALPTTTSTTSMTTTSMTTAHNCADNNVDGDVEGWRMAERVSTTMWSS